MSSWNFNSWDFKDSFTYKMVKKARKSAHKTVKSAVKMDAKSAEKILKEAFFKNSSNDNQQEIDSQKRTPPGTHNTAYRKSESDSTNYTNQSKKDYDKGYYRYSYVNNKKDNENYEDVTQNNFNKARKSSDKFKKNNTNKSKYVKKQDSVVTDVIVVREKSCVPFYSVMFFWIISALLMNLYNIRDILITAGISVLVFFIFSKIFKGKKKYINIEKEAKETGDEKADKIIKSGIEFAKKIHEANIAIENDILSEQISRLEEVCLKITDFITENPSKASRVRKFMNYYLPTTMKLLDSYDTLEEQEVNGKNINETMKSIEDAMGTIVLAFERQLDSLFEDAAMDISTDISVLENMLEQEGLINSNE
ncbi:MAG: 5-bromo-4-chloroindolyl phosphate hydrolysis family protein [Clostridia bacterium]|nr:5-bromo-4-chloroindolyl phosphate hydrolysis family protein [Clostridia bacterium]